MPTRPSVPLAVIATLVALVLHACATEPTPNPSGRIEAPTASLASPASATESAAPGTVPVATTSPGSPGMDALAAGVLGGVAAPEVACFWFEGEGRRTALVWPFGFSARFDPLRLLGGDGQVLATIGDEVELGGGVLPIDRQPRPQDDPCGTGAIFIVSEVATVDGVPLHVRGGSLALDVRSTPDTACQNASEVELMLVMDDGRLRVRDGISGPSRPATWPPGSTAHWGLRIVVLDADGDDLMLQGVEQVLRARVGDQLIDVCG